jgi:hypothetical protein
MRISANLVVPAALAIASIFTGCTIYGYIEPGEKGGATGTNVSGAGTTRCPELCAKLEENLCTRDHPQDKCVTYCESDTNSAIAAGCGKQHEAYVECGIQASYVCSGDQISTTTGCDGQMLDWGTCLAHPKDAGALGD